MKSQYHLSRRFAIFSLVQALIIFLAIFLSIQYFGQGFMERTNSVGLILTVSDEEHGWPSDMRVGLQAACDSLGYDLYVEDEVNIAGGALPSVTDKLVKRGVKNIFLINPVYQNDLDLMARQYPHVNFFMNAVGNNASNELYNYSVRYYEVRYLAGMLAALHSKNGIIGYVAPFPNQATRRDLNAYALGAQSVRPDVRILVRWTEHWMSPEREQEAIYLLRLRGADVMTYFLASQNAAQEAQRQQVDYIDFHQTGVKLPSHCIASIETDWQKIFTDLLRERASSNEHHLYWQGMLDDVIKLHLSPDLTPRETALVTRARNKIIQGYPVFSGEIVDQSGIHHCREGEVIAADSLLKEMNWLVKGVEIIESK